MNQTATPAHDVRPDVLGRIQMGHGLLQKDIAAMSAEMLSDCPGGKARTGFDLIFELSAVNRMVAGIIRGETNEAPVPDGWMRAPSDFCNKETALAELNASIDDLSTSFGSVSSERVQEEADTPLGRLTIGQLASIMAGHLMYHSGQLNYIQTFYGDDEFHWMDA